MSISRRAFMNFTALIGVGALAGCASLVTTPTGTTVAVSTISADLQYINVGLVAIIAAVASKLNVTDMTTINNLEGDVSKVLAEITASGTTITIPNAQNYVTAISDDVSAIIKLAESSGTLPANVDTILSAINSLLPVVEAAIGLAIKASASKMRMTPTQARMVLKGIK